MNESKVMQFIEKFDELYAKNKGVIFQSFQEGGFTLSEQKEIFDGLKTKQKCQLYNTISVDSRKNFYNSLSASDAEKFKNAIRGQAVNDARMIEQSAPAAFRRGLMVSATSSSLHW